MFPAPTIFRDDIGVYAPYNMSSPYIQRQLIKTKSDLQYFNGYIECEVGFKKIWKVLQAFLICSF